MNETESIAVKIASGIQDGENHKIDPITIAIIISAIKNLIECLYNREGNSAKAAHIVKDISNKDRREIKRILRKKLGLLRYLVLKRAISLTIDDTTRAIDENKMEKLYEENIDGFKGTVGQ
jgi:hypothetical protein